MPRATKTTQSPELTLEERRERRRLRREKQREDNVHRAAKMHAARLKMQAASLKATPERKASLQIGCSGWRYWKWRDSFYAEVPQADWFKHYLKRFDTVEINASFYAWPTVANVQSWRRGPGKKKFIYTVKVCELITHVKKFKGTKTLIKDFGMIADVLGDRMGCFLFQLPPSYRYTKGRLNDIVSQLDPARRNVAEFRHAGWWNEEVYSAFRKAGIIFCSCSGPRLPDELVRTADEVYAACMVLNVGIGTTTRRRSSRTGRPRSRIVARQEPGSISTTIMMLTRRKMPRHCDVCYSEDKAFANSDVKQPLRRRAD
jgi:uncharacterized protein YecE (DUF72 family)